MGRRGCREDAVKTIALVICALIVLLGLVFLIASAEGRTIPRLIAGGALTAVGLFLIVYIARRGHGGGAPVVIEQRMDFTGDASLEELRCTSCGATLTGESVTVRAGAVFVACPYCRAEYQIEEKPKW